MNLAIQPGLPRAEPPAKDAGVYADLRELAALEYRARGYSLLPRQPVTSLLAGRRASRLRGRGLNFEEIRAYLPGDDVRSMDWRITARMAEPYVRVYTEERDRPCLLLVDQRWTMFFGSRQAMKSVVAARLAALAAWRVFHAQDRVGAIVLGDRDCTEIRPLRSRARVMQILQTVVKANRSLRASAPDPARADMLNEALRKARHAATHDYLVCLISDGYGADAESVRLVTELSEHNDFLTLFVFDPLEAELPAAGRLVASDGCQQIEFDSRDRSLRLGFQRDFADRLGRMRTLARERGSPLLPISTAEEVLPQIQRHLGYHPPARRF